MRHLDISHVRDIRTGKGVRVPKDPKVREVLSMGTPGDLEDKTVTIVYSTDFVNVYFVNFYTRTSDVAKVSASCSTYWLMRSGMFFFTVLGHTTDGGPPKLACILHVADPIPGEDPRLDQTDG